MPYAVAMAMTGEFSYYATRSGLSGPASLADHKLAFWRSKVANSSRMTLSDVELAYYRQEDAVTGGSLADRRYGYFSTRSGLPAGRSISDHRAAFFANPPASVTAIVLSQSPANPVSVAVNPTVTLTAVVTGTPSGPVQLWVATLSGGTYTDSESVFTDAGGGVWTYALDASADAGETYYFKAFSAVFSNEQAIVLVA